MNVSPITSSPQLIHSGARPDHRRLPLASTSLRRPPDPKRCACGELASASIKHSTLENCSVMFRTLSQSYSCSPLTFASRTASYSWPVAAAMGRAAATEKQRANPTNHRADRQATQQHLKMSDRRDDFACMISHSQVSHVDFRLHDFAFQVLRTWSAKSVLSQPLPTRRAVFQQKHAS